LAFFFCHPEPGPELDSGSIDFGISVLGLENLGFKAPPCGRGNLLGDLMAAYIIAKVNITDWDQYKEYTKVTPGVIEKFGGRFLARGGEIITLEGPEETRRVVILEFPSLEKAKEFYYSKEYTEAKKLREGVATASFLLIDGYQKK
jgi:uncharacterized protein (DUF1330 family)